jgi:hypothetical protein
LCYPAIEGYCLIKRGENMWSIEVEEIKNRYEIIISLRYWAVDGNGRRVMRFRRREAAQQFCDLQNNPPNPPLPFT